MAETSTIISARDFLEPSRPNRLGTFLGRFFKRPINAMGLAIIVFLLAVTLAAPVLTRLDPKEQDLSSALSAPTAEHWFGTDRLGRDIYSRVVWGSRVSLTVGLGAVALALVLGAPFGLVSGYYGRWVDSIIMRVMDAIMAFPAMLLILVVATVLGGGVRNTIIAIGIVSAPSLARLIRGDTLRAREFQYVEAARSVGASNRRMLLIHILPNVVAPVIVQASLQVGGAIVAEAGLSFLGLCVEPGTPTWGAVLRETYGYMETIPWASIAPGVAITLAVLGFNFLGDGLRDSMDPYLHGS